MKVLIRQALITDPTSSFHLQRADIFIHNGIIKEIGKGLSMEADEVIDQKGLVASPGWCDPFAHFADPGGEHTETLETGAAAAAAGGYTDVMLLPNTKPVMHSKSMVEYVSRRQTSSPVQLHPIAAVTIDAQGKELAEMYDMHASGSVAFSDGLCPLQSSGVMLKALQYLKAINRTLIQLPEDRSIHPQGLVNEGVVSTQLGLAGKPAIAEEILIMRDIELLGYTNSGLHITGISTARSLELIKQAKNKGLNITCSVSPYHLFFTDDDLVDYDTNLKVSPPLRTKADRDALRKGVLDGSIDCIASHHLPRHTDDKIVEFEHAKTGMIGLQTAFAVVKTAVPELTAERITDLFSTNARRIFNLGASIAKDQKACITLFDPDQKWSFDLSQNRSRSSNTAFTGITLTGKPVGIINKGSLFLS